VVGWHVDAEAVQVVDGGNVVTGERVRHRCTRWQLLGAHRPCDVLVGEVQYGQLVPTWFGQLVYQHEHRPVRHLRDVDLPTGGDAVVIADPQDGLELPHEAGLVGQLLWNGTVETAATRHASGRLRRLRVHSHQIVSGAVNPTGVAAAQQIGHLIGRQGEHSAQIPSREREDTGLQRVEHHQEKMRSPDGIDVIDVVQVGDPQCRGDDRAAG